VTSKVVSAGHDGHHSGVGRPRLWSSHQNRNLERVVGGMTISKVSDASSSTLFTKVVSGEPSPPPKSIDVWKFVQAFG
jgi:hypothetical protein